MSGTMTEKDAMDVFNDFKNETGEMVYADFCAAFKALGLGGDGTAYGSVNTFIEYLGYCFETEDEEVVNRINASTKPYPDVGELSVKWEPCYEDNKGTKVEPPEIGEIEQLIGKEWTFKLEIKGIDTALKKHPESLQPMEGAALGAYVTYTFFGTDYKSEPASPGYTYSEVHTVNPVTAEFVAFLSSKKPLEFRVFPPKDHPAAVVAPEAPTLAPAKEEKGPRFSPDATFQAMTFPEYLSEGFETEEEEVDVAISPINIPSHDAVGLLKVRWRPEYGGKTEPEIESCCDLVGKTWSFRVEIELAELDKDVAAGGCHIKYSFPDNGAVSKMVDFHTQTMSVGESRYTKVHQIDSVQLAFLHFLGVDKNSLWDDDSNSSLWYVAGGKKAFDAKVVLPEGVVPGQLPFELIPKPSPDDA